MREAAATNRLLRQRLHNQKLARSDVRRPSDVVAWLGAVQAQDYPGAKWALGLRAPGLTDEDVEKAFTEGSILRTHVMRPTWHFVAPADIRWILALTGPRVNANNALYYRKLGLDAAVLARSLGVLERSLRDGVQLRAIHEAGSDMPSWSLKAVTGRRLITKVTKSRSHKDHNNSLVSSCLCDLRGKPSARSPAPMAIPN